MRSDVPSSSRAEGGHGTELGGDGPALGPGVDTDDDRAPPHRRADDAKADHPETYDDDRGPHADLGQVDAVQADSGHDEEAPRIGGDPGGQQLGPMVARGVEHGHGRVRPRAAVERLTRAPELQGGVATVVDRVADGVAGDVRAYGHDDARGHIARHYGEAPPIELPGEHGELGPDAHPRPQGPDSDIVLPDRRRLHLRQPEHPVRLGDERLAGQTA